MTHHLPYRYSDIFLSSDQVDVIVLDPGAEQCIGGTYVAPWPFLTLDDQGEWAADDGERVVRFINNTLKLTPVRYPKDALLGRLGASIVATTAAIGARVNIGTGLPEEVSIALKNVSDLIEPFNEGGALGGVSAPGTFFGAAICPKEIVSSAEVYTRVYQRLDVVVVGGLEVDESGNVNVACRADPLGYVGVGGFVDLTCAAKICVFAVAFATGSKIEVDEAGTVRINHPGKCKFLRQVREVHFSGPAALKAGKQVFYVTHLGAFELTKDGLVLVSVFPGVDPKIDIVEAAEAKILLPMGGAAAVKVASGGVLSGGAALDAELSAALHAGEARL